MQLRRQLYSRHDSNVHNLVRSQAVYPLAYGNSWVLAGIEPCSPHSQCGTLTEYATNTVFPRGFEPRRTPSKGVGLPLAEGKIWSG